MVQPNNITNKLGYYYLLNKNLERFFYSDYPLRESAIIILFFLLIAFITSYDIPIELLDM